MKYRYDRSDSAARTAKRHGVSRQWVNSNREPRPKPTFDADGYPTEETLRTVSEWRTGSNFAIRDLLSYVEDAWRYDFVISRRGSGRMKKIRIATHGWSGNEDLMMALMENSAFWTLCWLESRRGGGYVFLTSPFDEL